MTLLIYISGVSLSCYRCGSLSSNARKIEDCQGPNTVEECAENEACVVFKRLYKKGSGKPYYLLDMISQILQ